MDWYSMSKYMRSESESESESLDWIGELLLQDILYYIFGLV